MKKVATFVLFALTAFGAWSAMPVKAFAEGSPMPTCYPGKNCGDFKKIVVTTVGDKLVGKINKIVKK